MAKPALSGALRAKADAEYLRRLGDWPVGLKTGAELRTQVLHDQAAAEWRFREEIALRMREAWQLHVSPPKP